MFSIKSFTLVIWSFGAFYEAFELTDGSVGYRISVDISEKFEGIHLDQRCPNYGLRKKFKFTIKFCNF